MAHVLLSALSIQPIQSGFVRMYLDVKGNILGPTDEPGKSTPASIWEELVDAGNVRHYLICPKT